MSEIIITRTGGHGYPWRVDLIRNGEVERTSTYVTEDACRAVGEQWMQAERTGATIVPISPREQRESAR